ncbi:MAG: hypothetical protein AAGG68_29605, partial [Bacteroidota bacterium]
RKILSGANKNQLLAVFWSRQENFFLDCKRLDAVFNPKYANYHSLITADILRHKSQLETQIEPLSMRSTSAKKEEGTFIISPFLRNFQFSTTNNN